MDLRHLFAKQFTLLGSYMGGRREMLEVLEFLNSGLLKPVIDRTYPLSEAAEAHRCLDSRAQFGKVVLIIG
jgi:NADPH:quinone reductase-like Zn-dependent oxidoreductase